MAWKLNKSVKVFTLDTGRLHSETYRFIEQVRDHYGIAIEIMTPDPALLQPLVNEKGLFSFYRDGHGECCGIRKIEPLRRKLSTVRAWATGQRRDQSPGTRSQVAVLELDTAFSTPDHPLYKFNPLAQMTSEEVWGYIRMLEIPTTACTSAGSSVSAVSPALGRCYRTSTSVKVAGGGGSHPQGMRAARRQSDRQELTAHSCGRQVGASAEPVSRMISRSAAACRRTAHPVPPCCGTGWPFPACPGSDAGRTAG